MDIEQAAVTATNVVIDGNINITIYRDPKYPEVISLLFLDEQEQDIIHEVNVEANSHTFIITKDLKRLVDWR